MYVKITDTEILDEVPKVAIWKKMAFKDAEKAEVGLKFGWPSERTKWEDVDIQNSNMLGNIHIDMLEWLSRRDCDVPTDRKAQKIAYFSPDWVCTAFRKIVDKNDDKDGKDYKEDKELLEDGCDCCKYLELIV